MQVNWGGRQTEGFDTATGATGCISQEKYTHKIPTVVQLWTSNLYLSKDMRSIRHRSRQFLDTRNMTDANYRERYKLQCSGNTVGEEAADTTPNASRHENAIHNGRTTCTCSKAKNNNYTVRVQRKQIQTPVHAKTGGRTFYISSFSFDCSVW